MNSKIKPYILLFPAVFIILGIITSGITIAFAESIGYFPVIGLEKLTLNYYKEVLLNGEFLASFKFSLYTSLASSLIAIILGVIIAFAILYSNNKKLSTLFLQKLPIAVPHTIAALLLYNILAQSGMLPRIFYLLGIIKEQNQFPSLIFDNKGIGIILTYLWKEVPFVTMVVYGVLSNINEKLSMAAANLGASRKQVFRYVLLPLCLPTIASSFIIIFAFSFGAFEVPYLLGPTLPKALPVKAYIEYINADLSNRPYAMVINMVLIFISFILMYLYEKSLKLIYRK